MWKWIVLMGCIGWNETFARQGFPIVISELMGDPLPSVGLPAEEFIELTNVSDETIDISGWMVTNGRTKSQLPDGSWLKPGGILILCAARAADLFRVFGSTAGLSPFPTIANTGDTIELYNMDNVLVHAAAYRPILLGNEKSHGGWSLELVDLTKACRINGNWKVSVNPLGGSPGSGNSVLNELSEEGLVEPVHAWAFDENTLRLVFNEAVQKDDAIRPEHYQMPGGITIKNCRALAPFFQEIEIQVQPALVPGSIYSISTSGIGACDAMPGGGGSLRTLKIGMAGTQTQGLIINELLFDPPANGADFVELYHSGETALNLANMRVASRTRSGEINGARPLVHGNRFLYPGEYLVLTTDVSWLIRSFHVKDPHSILEMPSLPGLPNESGTIVLLQDSIVLEELKYDANWHHPMVRNKEGISLERIDFHGPTQSRENWASAASHVGYATPGYQNSQLLQEQEENRFYLENNWFSPDGDGQMDICRIIYRLKQPGFLCSIRIFNRHGRLLRVLVNNGICAQSGVFDWNGTGEGGRVLPDGLYFLVADTWYTTGKTKRYRMAVTLSKK